MEKIPMSVSNWKPSTPSSDSVKKMLSPNAHDAKDTVDATNTLDQYEGKSGAPKGPFGKKGKLF